MCNGPYRQIRVSQKDAGLPDPVVQKIVLDGHAGNGLKETVEIGAVQPQTVGDVLDRDGIAVITFNEFQRCLHVAGLFLFRHILGAGELAGQQKQIFVQDTVHDPMSFR